MAPTISLDRVPLAPDTAKQLARAADRIDKAREEWERLIVEAWAGGASLREIAEHAGITHVGVDKLVDRWAANRPDYVVLDKDGNPIAIIELKQPHHGRNDQGE